ncbi:MAG: Yip1 family protein [Burkholderiaceae bacterium]|nr:Yip1 family protein [Burkholderiaceae bacterium]
MSIINRVKDILLKPKETWLVIEAEETTPATLYKKYLLILAIIPAVSSFIGMSLVGVGGFGLSLRIPILSGLVNMVVQYVMSLVMIYVFSLIINVLAPSFGGQKNPIQALKLAVYGATASMVGGVFGILPVMSILSVLCGLYSIYLIYLGLPVLMKNPSGKSALYTIVILLVGIFAGMLMALVTRIITPNPHTLGGAGSGDALVRLKTPDGEVKIDTSKIDAATKKMEEAQKRMEEAQKSGDASAMAKAAGDVAAAATGIMGGDANLLPLPAETIKPYLLPQIQAFKRVSFEVHAGNAMGIVSTTASADYRAGNQMAFLTVSDFGGMNGLVRMGGSLVSGEKETASSAEKTWQENGRTLHQEYDKDGSRAAMKVILKNGIVVELKSQQANIDALRSMMSAIDLNGLENAQRPKKS